MLVKLYVGGGGGGELERLKSEMKRPPTGGNKKGEWKKT
jgi:hypothetical protein